MRRIGRYVLHDKLASGGMAAVHLGQMLGDAGFARPVAIKRLHPHVADDPAAVRTFLDEAWLSARVRHPNIVPTLDVVEDAGEILLVFEYVHGATLGNLGDDAAVPLPIVVAIINDALTGLQAVHDACDRDGPLSIVHRDVSPQNIMVGEDGVARVLDFGIAKARARLQTTEEGVVKGKLRYMAPEQLRAGEITPATDLYGCSVVLWELLARRRLFDGPSEGAIVAKVLEGVVLPPSRYASEVTDELDAIVLRGLSREPDQRFSSCREMASALRAAVSPAPADAVGRWLGSVARQLLDDRAALLSAVESGTPGVARLAQAPAGGTATMPLVAPVHGESVPAPKARPRKGRAIALAAVLASVGGLSAALVLARAHPEPPPPMAVPSADPPAPSVAPPPQPSVVLPEEPPPPQPQPTRAVRTPPRPAKVTVKPKPPPRVNCNPPYRIENGIRIPKPECP